MTATQTVLDNSVVCTCWRNAIIVLSCCTHNEFVLCTVLMLVLALESGLLVLEQCWSPHLQNTNPKKRKKENVNCYTNASVEMSVLFTCSL